MFISKKKYKETVEEVMKENNKLRTELAEAKQLKLLLEKLSEGVGQYLTCSDGTISIRDMEMGLSDAIPRYVEDYFGGKVIKQEATKVIHITKEGEVKTGLTKKPADKNYNYLLKRD